jgi:predicted dehydrogenase
MKRILRFGVVGCGRIAGNHLRALASDQVPAELVAVVDVKEDRAREKAEQYRVPYYLDYHDMAQQASHHLDLLQWFMGPVERLQCQIATRLLKIEAEDTAAALFRFESGALGVFEATTATRPTDLEASLSILGEHGSVILGGNAVNRIEHWQFDPELPEDAQVRAAASQDVPDVYGHGHGDYLAAVVRSILSNQSGMVEGAEGRKNVVILTALYESAARGGLPVRPGVRIRKARIGRRSPDAPHRR